MRDPVARRRLTALGVIAAVALVTGLLVARKPDSTGHSDQRSAARAGTVPSSAAKLSLRRRVGELLVMSFDGTSAPGYVLRRLRDGEGTGVILFGKNAPEAATTRVLTESLQRAAGDRALIATDQEGGDIRSLAFSAPESSQGRLGGVDASRAAATAAATGLKLRGVNVNLAPVADVADSLSSAVAGRTYAGGPSQVAAMVVAAIPSYRARRVGSTVKHFPGLGRALTNTDDQATTVSASKDELLESDIPPFTAAIRARTPLVMVSHALYPALDRRAIASQSRPIVTGLLRRRLGFRGVVVTDSIEAQAVLDRNTIAAAAQRSIDAGVDLILMTGSGSFNQIQPALLRRTRSDPRFAAKVTAAAERVIALKRRLGLRAPPR